MLDDGWIVTEISNFGFPCLCNERITVSFLFWTSVLVVYCYLQNQSIAKVCILDQNNNIYLGAMDLRSGDLNTNMVLLVVLIYA